MTLDEDVAARLEQLIRLRRQPLKVVVNDVLRAGLAEIEKPQVRAPFQTTGFDLGPSLIGSLDDVEGVLARIDGERHR
jgi:hypothetical protein